MDHFVIRPTATTIAVAMLACMTPPALSQELTATDLIEAVDLGSVQSSPDGREVAVYEVLRNVSHDSVSGRIVVVDVESGRVARTFDAGEPEFGIGGALYYPKIKWNDDGIYFRRQLGSDAQIWRGSANGSSAQLGSVPKIILDFDFAPDGRSLLVRTLGTSNTEIDAAERVLFRNGVQADDEFMPQLPLFNAATRFGKPRSQRSVIKGPLAGKFLFLPPTSERPLELYSVSPTGDVRTATEQEVLAYPMNSTPGNLNGSDPVPAPAPRNGKTITFSAKADLGVRSRGLQLEDRRNGLVTRCIAAACERYIHDYRWREDKDEVLFLASESAASFVVDLFAWDTTSGKVRRLSYPGSFITLVGRQIGLCPQVKSELVCVVSDASQPSSLMAIPLDGGPTRTLYDPNKALRSRLLPSEQIAWKGSDGNEYRGWITVPRGPRSGPLPLVITSHVCVGFLRGGTGEYVPEQLVAQAGMISVCANRNGEASNALNSPVGRFRSQLASYEGLVAKLSANGIVDPAKVGLGGHSTAAVGTWWTVSHSKLLAAATVSSPSPDITAYDMMAPEAGRSMSQGYGVPVPSSYGDKTGWSDLSILLNIDKIDTPILAQYPEFDFRWGLAAFYALRRAHKPMELYAFADELHFIQRPAHRAAINERNIEWFRFWLQNHESAEPSKSEQNRRWRELKAESAAAGE